MVNSERITEDITWRIAVARNLADVYNTLHNAGYYVVDTKPANIRTYKMVPGVCLLDCDGFKLKNSPFEGDMITPDYIAPESIGKPPAQLGREQDIFALSVLIFQLLNNGIHPYSGILNKNDTIDLLSVDITQINYSMFGAIKHIESEIITIKEHLGITEEQSQENAVMYNSN